MCSKINESSKKKIEKKNYHHVDASSLPDYYGIWWTTVFIHKFNMLLKLTNLLLLLIMECSSDYLDLHVMIAFPSCVNTTPEHVKLGTQILSNSCDVCTLHTRTSSLPAVANTSEYELKMIL